MVLFPGPMIKWNFLIQEVVSFVDPPSSAVVACFVISSLSAQGINAFFGLLVLNALLCMNLSISGVSLAFSSVAPPSALFQKDFSAVMHTSWSKRHT